MLYRRHTLAIARREDLVDEFNMMLVEVLRLVVAAAVVVVGGQITKLVVIGASEVNIGVKGEGCKPRSTDFIFSPRLL